MSQCLGHDKCINDIGGGSAFFKSRYVVASDALGPVWWSLGYAAGSAPANAAGGKLFDGLFGGAEKAKKASN